MDLPADPAASRPGADGAPAAPGLLPLPAEHPADPAADPPWPRWSAQPLPAAAAAQALAWDGTRLWVAGPGVCGTLGPPWPEPAWADLGQGAAWLRAGVRALLPGGGGCWVGLPHGLAHAGPAGGCLVWDADAGEVGAGEGGGPLALAAHRDRLWLGLHGGGIAWRSLDPAQPGGPTLVWHLPGSVRALAPAPEGWWAACDAGLFWCGAAGVRRIEATAARALLPQGEGYLVATADGLRLLTPDGACRAAPGDATLPVRDLWHLARTGDGALWGGGPCGLVRAGREGWHYHQGPRWLPDDAVLALAGCGPDLVAATSAGSAVLRAAPTTLAAKAAALQARVAQRHLRLGCFVEEAVLPGPGVTAGAVPDLSDNDGLWTGLYLAAQSYRYAATGEAEARREAERAFGALEWLEAVTTIPGYVTKCIVPADTHPGGTWYPSADGHWRWKGDCSSDEIVGHFYAYSLYHDLVADAAGRRRVAALVRRILDHILGNGLRILEFGRRTRWGYWNPEALNGPEGRWGDRGLNSLEILSHLRVAARITGDPGYAERQAALAHGDGYLDNLARVRPDVSGLVNHSDDELAFLAFDPLLRYETDPALRAAALASLRRAWALERPERNPLWNFIYVAHTGDREALPDALRTLGELPEDTIAWPVRNARRADLTLDPTPDRHRARQATRVLPYDEIALTRWNDNPYVCDGGNARREGDGVHYLLPYWMGRWHGWISG